MNVLQIVPSLNVGGAERATVDVAAALVAAGHRALVMSSGGPLVEPLVRSGAEYIACDVASKNPWVIWKNRRLLIDVIKIKHIDIVHVRSRAPAWSAYLATRALGVPLVTTFHSPYSGGTPFKNLYNSVMAKGDRVIAISQFIADHIRAQYGTSPSRIVTIPRGTDFSTFDPAAVPAERRDKFRSAHALPSGTPVIILPGRLSSVKGHELTLQALARVTRPFVCLIIGPDQGRKTRRESLVTFAKTLDLSEKMRFLATADLHAAYAVADLVLSPKQGPEGFGRVPVEAQAMGVPVIATALGATSETILDGETGWLVPPGDAQALAHAIERALSLTAEQRRIMADKAMRHVRANFDSTRMCAATLKVYDEVLRDARGAAGSGP